MTAQLRGSPEIKMTLIPGCAVFFECLRTSAQDRKKNFMGKKYPDCCCWKTLLLVSFIIVQICLAMVILGRGGLMVSALDSGASGPGSSPGRGHCVVFLGKTLTVPPSTQVYKWLPVNLMLGGNPAMD